MESSVSVRFDISEVIFQQPGFGQILSALKSKYIPPTMAFGTNLTLITSKARQVSSIMNNDPISSASFLPSMFFFGATSAAVTTWVPGRLCFWDLQYLGHRSVGRFVLSSSSYLPTYLLKNQGVFISYIREEASRCLRERAHSLRPARQFLLFATMMKHSAWHL